MNWAFNIGYMNGFMGGFFNRFNDFYEPGPFLFGYNTFYRPFFNFFRPSYDLTDYWRVQRCSDTYDFNDTPYRENKKYSFVDYSNYDYGYRKPSYSEYSYKSNSDYDYGYGRTFNSIKKSEKTDISQQVTNGKTSEKDNIFLGHTVTSGFGKRKHPVTGKWKQHNGIDLRYALNEDVYSFTEGIVTNIGYEKNGYGNWIEITDKNGVKHRYAHANKIVVQKGQEIKAGELIMKAGQTGAATGPHVHYETIVNGNKVNPFTTWA